MKPSIYKVDAPFLGSLFIMPKPSGEWLYDDLMHYDSLGVRHIVSLLCDDEIRELSLEKEEELCRDIDLSFTNFSIADRGLPEIESFTVLVGSIAGELTKGKSVAVHCRAGIGRAGILTCCLLKKIGVKNDRAIELVSQARGVEVPDTDNQKEFISNFEVSLE